MEFEEMKKIWDSQNNENLYVINETALHIRIKQKGRSINRNISFFEWAMIGTTLGVSLILTIDTIVEAGSWPRYLSSGIIFIIFLYMYGLRRERQKYEQHFNDSLLGDLDKAISRIDYIIGRTRTLLWWYLIPFTVAASISMYFDSKPFWLWCFMILVFGLSYWGGEKEIRHMHMPKKRDLESLRATLLES
jgi:hypothetical protein